MQKKIKVLMILPNLCVSSGVVSFAMNYFRAIDHRKIQMDFAIYWDVPTPNYDEIKTNGGKVYILPSIKDIKEHSHVCEHIIQKGNYDIVHDNTLLVSMVLMYYARKYNVPVRILHSHSSKLGETELKGFRNKLFMPLLRSMATDYCACSKVAAKGMFGNKKVIIIPNIISTDKYIFSQETREKIRKKFNVSGSFLVGTVGRLAAPKNPFYAIDCIVEAKKIISNLQYWWIGTGPLNEQVKEYISKKEAGDYIHLLGSRIDIPELYQAMDLFFLPSHFEGLPLTGLEAQASGLPCLVSNAVSNEFVYTDQVSFFSLRDSVDKVCCMIQQVQAKADEKRRETSKVKLLSSPFSDKGAGEQLTLVYKRLLSQHEK